MSNPFDFFEIIYCINLPERKDRWQKVAEQFTKYGIADKVLQIPGKKVTTFADPHRNAAYGNHLSHAYCMERSKALGYNNCLIFEDDVEFLHAPDNFAEFLFKSLYDLPTDWDMFYFGANLDIYKAIKKTPSLAKLTGAFATHAYAVNSSVYDELIRVNKNQDTIHNDVVYANEIIPSHNVYISIPMLAGQADSYSDIEGKRTSYNSMMLERFQRGLVD